MRRFGGKVVLVTGAGHGIGRAVAERFAAEGARVAVNDVDAQRAAGAAHAIGATLAVAADVSNKPQVDTMFDRVEAELGPIDVLVNNAGNIYAARHFLEGDEAWWDQVVDVNLKGAYLCSQRVAISMARRRSGVLVGNVVGADQARHDGVDADAVRRE